MLDKTGIHRRFDLTLAFSSANRLPHAATDAQSEASTPSGAVSRQMGLKLVKEKRSLPVLVIDHIERKPTEN